MKIRKKLIIAFVLPIMIIGIFSLAGFLWNKRLFVEATDVSSNKIRNALMLNEINNEMSRYTKSYLITYDPESHNKFDAAKPIQKDKIADYASLPLTDEESKYFADVQKYMQINTAIEEKLYVLTDGILSNLKEEQDLLFGSISPTLDKWIAFTNTDSQNGAIKNSSLYQLHTDIITFIALTKYSIAANAKADKKSLDLIDKMQQEMDSISKLQLNSQEMSWYNIIQKDLNSLVKTSQDTVQKNATTYELLYQEEELATKIDDILDEKLYVIANERDKNIEHTILLMNATLEITITCLIILGVLLSLVFARFILNPIDYLKESIKRLRSGENIEVKRTSNDEIGDLSDAFGDLVKENRTHASELNEQGWLKEHVAEILKTAQQEATLDGMCNAVTSKIANLLDAGCGAFYITHEDETKVRTLHLLGTYGYKKRKNLSNEFKFGESIVGQAALEGNPIIISDVPPDYIHISSGLGDKQPNYIIVLPIKIKNRTLGVMEFALFHKATDIQQQFLEQLSNNLAVVIEAIQNREKAEIALKRVQESSEELQVQQEELRTTNEELEEKTHVLQKSEEELKAQSEEMQASNEELEEKMHAIEAQKQEIQTKNSELETIRAELEAKAADLARAGKYKTEFLANMSHELRTPLNSLLLLSSSFAKNEDKNLTPDQIEQAGIIYKGGKDLLTLINDILDLSKVEAGKLNIQIEDASITEILDDLRTQFEGMMHDKGLEFIIESNSKIDIIKTDPYRLKQILRNLISNAYKFTSIGHIKLSVTIAGPDLKLPQRTNIAGKKIVFQVTDTGIGIEKQKFNDIFEAFQQAYGDTDRKYGGTGLGLTISRELAKILGGEIILDSEVGIGSTFYIILPLKEDKVIDNIAPLTLSKVMPQKKITNEKIILLVENDVEFINHLQQVTKRKGYKCITASDADSALAMVKEYNPDGIILGLSDKDNTSIITALKDAKNTNKTPIHVITSNDSDGVTQNQQFVKVFKKSTIIKEQDEILSFFDQENSTTLLPILLVEDNLITQKAVVVAAKSKGIEIVTAENGNDALEKLSKQKFSGIILDLMLPDFDGLTMLKKSSERNIVLPPVIVYSDKDLTYEEYQKLNEYTSKIVMKEGDSSLERLLNECSLFLHSMLKNDQKTSNISLITDTDTILHDKEVLLVDDDMRNVYALSMILKRHGMHVTVATNGEEALNKLDAMPHADIVIMDIMMPIMDGYETTKQIRKKSQFKNLPIIAVTAKAMPDDKRSCIEAGANDYMTKPLDADKLLSMMRIWLSSDLRKS